MASCFPGFQRFACDFTRQDFVSSRFNFLMGSRRHIVICFLKFSMSGEAGSVLLKKFLT